MRGHSLIELVISIMIILTVVLGIVSVFPLTSIATRQSMSITNLTFLAQLKIEELKRREFSVDSTGVNRTDPELITGRHSGNFGDANELADKDFSAYGYETEVKDEMVCAEDPSIVFLKKITVTTYGPGNPNDKNTPKVTLSAYIRSYSQGTHGSQPVIDGKPFAIGPPPEVPVDWPYDKDPVTGKITWKNDANHNGRINERMARYYPVEILDAAKNGSAFLTTPKI